MGKEQADANEFSGMPVHERTYKSFTAFAIFGIASVAVVLVAMAIFLL